MAIMLNQDGINFFKGFGLQFPKMNEDQIRQIAEDFAALGGDFEQMAGFLSQWWAGMSAGDFTGKAADALAKVITPFFSGKNYLGQASDAAAKLAKYAEQTADSVEAMKIMAIGFMTQILIDIMLLLEYWFFPPAEEEILQQLREKVALMRIAFDLFKNIIMRFLRSGLAKMVFMTIAMPLIAAAVESAQGHNDPEALKQNLIQSIEFAGLGLAFGAGLHSAITPLLAALKDFLKSQFGKDLANDLSNLFKTPEDLPKGGGPGIGNTPKVDEPPKVNDGGLHLNDPGPNLGAVFDAHGNDLLTGFKPPKGGGAGAGNGGVKAPSPNPVEVFSDHMAGTFKKIFNGHLPPEDAGHLGAQYGKTFAEGWGSQPMSDLQKSLNKTLDPYRGKLPPSTINALSHGVPSTIDDWMTKKTRDYWLEQFGDLGVATGMGAVNMALTMGTYNVLFGPGKKFEVQGWMVGAGAGVGAMMHGATIRPMTLPNEDYQFTNPHGEPLPPYSLDSPPAGSENPSPSNGSSSNGTASPFDGNHPTELTTTTGGGRPNDTGVNHVDTNGQSNNGPSRDGTLPGAKPPTDITVTGGNGHTDGPIPPPVVTDGGAQHENDGSYSQPSNDNVPRDIPGPRPSDNGTGNTVMPNRAADPAPNGTRRADVPEPARVNTVGSGSGGSGRNTASARPPAQSDLNGSTTHENNAHENNAHENNAHENNTAENNKPGNNPPDRRTTVGGQQNSPRPTETPHDQPGSANGSTRLPTEQSDGSNQVRIARPNDNSTPNGSTSNDTTSGGAGRNTIRVNGIRVDVNGSGVRKVSGPGEIAELLNDQGGNGHGNGVRGTLFHAGEDGVGGVISVFPDGHGGVDFRDAAGDPAILPADHNYWLVPGENNRPSPHGKDNPIDAVSGPNGGRPGTETPHAEEPNKPFVNTTGSRSIANDIAKELRAGDIHTSSPGGSHRDEHDTNFENSTGHSAAHAHSTVGGVEGPHYDSGGEKFAEGTNWTRGHDGWFTSGHGGTIEVKAGPDGRPTIVDVPHDARGVFDGKGVLRHIVLPNGISHERGLDGRWSPPRERPGEVQVIKTGQVKLTSGDGHTVAVLRPQNEMVVDKATGHTVAYRQVTDDAGRPMKQAITFLPDDKGGWVKTKEPVDPATYEGWLASANKAHDAAKIQYDIAGRSDTSRPEHERLTHISYEELKNLLRGSREDAIAAIYEALRRKHGIALRWTQMLVSEVFTQGDIVNMAAGEGKSFAFMVDAARQALRSDISSAHVITTRGNLADREFENYQELLGPLGFAVHRMNSDNPPPAPVRGRPTIYIGTNQDVGFTLLKTGNVPGQHVDGQHGQGIHAGVDEIDEAFVYSDTSYILSEGAGKSASHEVSDLVNWAKDLVNGSTTSGWLHETDFGRHESQDGGAARLTLEGRDKVELLLGRPLSDHEVNRIDMAAAAKWEYVENVHYVRHQGKIYIIDQTTHEVLYNPETSSESRWNGGLAQAIEARLDLNIRDDPANSKSVTAQELYQHDAYSEVVGASGTANGKNDLFAGQGLSDRIVDVPRYYASRLVTEHDHVSPDLNTKLDTIAEHVAQMQGGGKEGRPQLVLAHRNDLVEQISKRLDGMGVEHVKIDAKWFLDQGTHREQAFKDVIKHAGEPGKVLVINMQGARGVDIPVSDAARELGGLHVRVTAHSAVSKDIDIQAANRAARSGGPGSVTYYISPDDDALRLSHNPLVKLAVIQYTDAHTALGDHPDSESARASLDHAEQNLRDLVPALQDAAARGLGMRVPLTHLPNAPPTSATAPATTSSTMLNDRPPQPPPNGFQVNGDSLHQHFGDQVRHVSGPGEITQLLTTTGPGSHGTVFHINPGDATSSILTAGHDGTKVVFVNPATGLPVTPSSGQYWFLPAATHGNGSANGTSSGPVESADHHQFDLGRRLGEAGSAFIGVSNDRVEHAMNVAKTLVNQGQQQHLPVRDFTTIVAAEYLRSGHPAAVSMSTALANEWHTHHTTGWIGHGNASTTSTTNSSVSEQPFDQWQEHIEQANVPWSDELRQDEAQKPHVDQNAPEQAAESNAADAVARRPLPPTPQPPRVWALDDHNNFNYQQWLAKATDALNKEEVTEDQRITALQKGAGVVSATQQLSLTTPHSRRIDDITIVAAVWLTNNRDENLARDAAAWLATLHGRSRKTGLTGASRRPEDAEAGDVGSTIFGADSISPDAAASGSGQSRSSNGSGEFKPLTLPKYSFDGFVESVAQHVRSPARQGSGGWSRRHSADNTPLTPERISGEYGIPEENQVRFQQMVELYNVVIDVRPSNPASVSWLRSGAIPKPSEIKAKTINELDLQLGASRENIGLVGYFRPQLSQSHVSADLSGSRKLAIDARFKEREEEFNSLANDMTEYEGRGMFRVRGGVVEGKGRDGEFHPVTGDHDVFQVRLPEDGRPLKESEYKDLVWWMTHRTMAVQHGAHMDWKPDGTFQQSVFDTILRKHSVVSLAPEPLIRFAPSEEPRLVYADAAPRLAASHDQPPLPVPMRDDGQDAPVFGEVDWTGAGRDPGLPGPAEFLVPPEASVIGGTRRRRTAQAWIGDTARSDAVPSPGEGHNSQSEPDDGAAKRGEQERRLGGDGTRPAPEHTTATGDGAHDYDQSQHNFAKAILDDESWRHSKERSAPWFEPKEPLSPEQWGNLRRDDLSRRVHTEIADVKTSSRIENGRLKLDKYTGLVRYDLRRLRVELGQTEGEPGRFVQEYTVILHLTGNDAKVESAKRDAVAAVDDLFNKGYRLPSGDQFHLRLEFADEPGDAHAVVQVGEHSTDQNHWSVGEKPAVLAHEVLHYLGPGDEYRDKSRVFLDDDRKSAVVKDDGVLGGRVRSGDVELKPRHLWYVERVSRDQVAVPDARWGHNYDGVDLGRRNPRVEHDGPAAVPPTEEVVYDGAHGSADRDQHTSVTHDELRTRPVPESDPGLRWVENYTVETPVGGPTGPGPFVRYEDAMVRNHAGFPESRPAQDRVVDAHPALLMSSDGTLAINAGAGAIQDVYAREDIVQQANAQLKLADSKIELLLDESYRIRTADGHVLRRISPVFNFRGDPPEVCRDFAGVVLGGLPDHLVFRSVYETVEVASSSGAPMEMTGVHDLAREISNEVRVGLGNALDPQWAAKVVAADRRPTAGTGSRGWPPGEGYGSMFSTDSRNTWLRSEANQAAERMGINQYAKPKVGEAYAISSIPTADEHGNPVYDVNHTRGVDSVVGAVAGYHFGTVVLTSADGRTHVTLENFRRPGQEDYVRRAVDATLEKNWDDIRGMVRGAEKAVRLAQANSADSRRAQHKLDLARALADMKKYERAQGSGAYARAHSSALHAMGALGTLASGGVLWSFHAYVPSLDGHSFHGYWGMLRTEAGVLQSKVNPLTVVAVGGHGGRSVRSVIFEGRSTGFPENQRQVVQVMAHSLARDVLWRLSNNMELLNVEIVGHHPEGSLLPKSVSDLGLQRAQAVAREFRRELNAKLSQLQGGRPRGVTDARVNIHVSSRGKDVSDFDQGNDSVVMASVSARRRSVSLFRPEQFGGQNPAGGSSRPAPQAHEEIQTRPAPSDEEAPHSEPAPPTRVEEDWGRATALGSQQPAGNAPVELADEVYRSLASGNTATTDQATTGDSRPLAHTPTYDSTAGGMSAAAHGTTGAGNDPQLTPPPSPSTEGHPRIGSGASEAPGDSAGVVHAPRPGTNERASAVSTALAGAVAEYDQAWSHFVDMAGEYLGRDRGVVREGYRVVGVAAGRVLDAAARLRDDLGVDVFLGLSLLQNEEDRAAAEAAAKKTIPPSQWPGGEAAWPDEEWQRAISVFTEARGRVGSGVAGLAVSELARALIAIREPESLVLRQDGVLGAGKKKKRKGAGPTDEAGPTAAGPTDEAGSSTGVVGSSAGAARRVAEAAVDEAFELLLEGLAVDAGASASVRASAKAQAKRSARAGLDGLVQAVVSVGWRADLPVRDLVRVVFYGTVAFDAEVLSALLRAPHVVTALLAQPVLGHAVQARPSLVGRLADAPTVLERLSDPALRQNPIRLRQVEGILDDAKLLAMLDRPGVMRAIEADPEMLGFLFNWTGLFRNLDGNVALVKRGVSSAVLGEALNSLPALGEWILSTPDPVATIDRVTREWGALGALLLAPEWVWPRTAAVFGELLGDTVFLKRMTAHGALWGVLACVPGMFRVVRDNPGLLDRLEERRLLVDVLQDAPAIGGRLAGDPVLLGAAMDNPAVAYLLSADVTVFDGVGDGQLQRALVEARVPDWVAEVERSSSAPRPEGASRPKGTPGLLASFPGLKGYLKANPKLMHPVLNQLKKEEEKEKSQFVSTLLEMPGEVRWPHEFGRLLHADARPLRAQLRPDSTLARPGVLVAALRNPMVARAFIGTEYSNRTLNGAITNFVQSSAAGSLLAEQLVTPWLLATHPMGASAFGANPALLEKARGDSRMFVALGIVVGFTNVLVAYPALLGLLTGHDAAVLNVFLHNPSLPLHVVALQNVPEVVAPLEVDAERGVLAAFAAVAPDLPESYWLRLLTDRGLYEALADKPALVRVLALRPELLREVVARSGFPGWVAADPSRGERFEQLASVALAAVGNGEQSALGVVDPFAGLRAAVEESGPGDLTEEGYPISVDDQSIARDLTDASSVDAAEDLLRARFPDWSSDQRRMVLDTRAEVLADPRLTGIVRSRSELAGPVYFKGGVLEVLRDRPAIMELFEKDPRALDMFLRDNTLAGVLARDDEAFLLFANSTHFRTNIVPNGYRSVALAQNPYYARFLATKSNWFTNQSRSSDLQYLLHEVSSVTRAVVEWEEVGDLLHDSKDLTHRLVGLAKLSKGVGMYLVNAVVAAPGHLKVVAGDVGLLSVLAKNRALSDALADAPQALAEADVFGDFLRNKTLMGQLAAHPELIGMVVGSVELTRAVMAAPGLVGVLAGSGRVGDVALADLLRGRDDVWRLTQRYRWLGEERGRPVLEALGRSPVLVRQMAVSSTLAGVLENNPELVGVLRSHRSLVDDAGKNTPLWRALVAHPELAARVNRRVLDSLRRSPVLVKVLASVRVDVTAVDGLVGSLAVRGFVWFLNENEEFARRFLSTPSWWDRVVNDPGFVVGLRELSRSRKAFIEMVTAGDSERLVEAVTAAAGSRTPPPSVAAGGVTRHVMPAVVGGVGLSMSDAVTEGLTAGMSTAADSTVDAVAEGLTTGMSTVAGSVVAEGLTVRGVEDVSGWVGRFAEAPGLVGLLAGRGGVGLAGAIRDNAELLPLLWAVPDVVVELAQYPDRLDGYLFRGFLQGSDTRELTNFGKDFARFLAGVDAESAVGDSVFRKAAGVTWAGVKAEQVAMRERVEMEKAQRFAKFRKSVPDTWEFSGRLSFADRVKRKFASHDEEALGRIAKSLEGFQEPRSAVEINGALHAHLDSGSGGIAFFYALDSDGYVFPHFYAVSSARQGNQYRWDGFGTMFVDGPPALGNVRNDSVLATSKGQVTLAGASVVARPVGASGQHSQPASVDVTAQQRGRLAGAVTEYHEAWSHFADMAGKHSKPNKDAVKSGHDVVTDAAGRVLDAAARLRDDLGVDVFLGLSLLQNEEDRAAAEAAAKKTIPPSQWPGGEAAWPDEEWQRAISVYAEARRRMTDPIIADRAASALTRIIADQYDATKASRPIQAGGLDQVPSG